MKKRYLWWGFALLLLMMVAAQAEERFPSTRLRSLGVNASSLQPVAFSHNDRLIATFDRAAFEDKKKGTFYRLWFFEIKRDGTLGETHMVPLSLKTLQQGEFTPDDKQFVLVGERGTTFLSVDLSDYSVHTIFEPEWGKAGFRSDPAVLWTEEGKLFVSGHPYDKARFVETSTVATLRPDAPPGERFQRGRDISTLEKGLERLWFTNYVTDSKAFFGQKYPEVTLLSFWDGDRVTEFDRAWKFLGFWGNAGRLVYAARRGEGQPCELLVYDSDSDKKTPVATNAKDFRYLFLSRDGSTLVTSLLSDTPGRLVPMYAKESEGWQLKPVVTDSKGDPATIPVGWIRLSSGGDMMCHVGATGLTLYPLR